MNTSATPRSVVVIPTYNEAENLAWLVRRVRASEPELDVLIVDDGSPDGTGGIADDLASADPQIMVLHRTHKEGLGAAYVCGFTHVLGLGYDVVAQMDADGSHSPEELGKLLGALNTCDVVIGSRWVPGGSVVNWPLFRRWLSRGGNWYVRLLLGVPVRDATAGFRVYRRTALATIGLENIESAGYVFQTDMVVRACKNGLRVVEVPIRFVERERGNSKMSRAVFMESLWRVTRWGLKTRWSKIAPAKRKVSSVSRANH